VIAMPCPILATPDLANFVAIEEAAELLGLHINSVARKAREVWEAMGWAIQTTPVDGGNPRWFISRDVDRRLSVCVEERPGDLSRFTIEQQRDARARAACVDAFVAEEKRRPGQPTKSWLAFLIEDLRGKFPHLSISKTSLHRWREIGAHDLEKLIDRRGGDRSEGEQRARDAIVQLCLRKNLSVAHARDVAVKAAAANGWEFDASLRTCQVWVKQIAEETRLLHLSPDKWAKQMQPTIEQESEAWAANQRWVLDHKTLDVFCTFGREKIRPVLTTVMDWRTRKIVGWCVAETPSRMSINAALRMALLDPNGMGKPDEVEIDNGKDFAAQDYHGLTKAQRRKADRPMDEADCAGIFQWLRIKAHFAKPYNPNSKSRLERFFRTVERPCRELPTYTGYSTETRPESLKEVLKNRALIPTMKRVMEKIGEHVAWFNARSDHQMADLVEDGKPISPNDAMARWPKAKVVWANPAAVMEALAFWSPPLTVKRKGIGLKLDGRTFWYGQFEHALSWFKSLKKADREKKLVRVRYDPDNLNGVTVYKVREDGDLVYVCEAPMNERGGGSGVNRLEHVKELNKRKARYKRNAKWNAGQHLRMNVLRDVEHLEEIAAESNLSAEAVPGGVAPAPQGGPASDPPALRIGPTSLDEAAGARGRETSKQYLKKAVGDGTPEPRELSGIEKLNAIYRKEREQRPTRREDDFEPAYLRRPS
jgi:transposase InsO family protein